MMPAPENVTLCLSSSTVFDINSTRRSPAIGLVAFQASSSLRSHQLARNRSRMAILSPQSVLITEANRGLGLEFVKQFLQLPQPPKYLFAGCRNPEETSELQRLATDHPCVRIVKLDVQDDASIAAAVSVFETVVGDVGLNLLLNNAGINNHERGIEQLTRGKLNNHFDVNVSGPIMVTKAFLPLLRKAAAMGDPNTYNCNRAAIVNITSTLSCIGFVNKHYPYLIYPYCSTKCALNMATSILSNEVSPNGILAVLLHPGWVKTDMGGPRAFLEIPDSVSQCMNALSSLDKSSSGRLITYAGSDMSWGDTDSTVPF